MANNVDNMLTFFAPEGSAFQVDLALRAIAKEIRRDRFDLGEWRVRLGPACNWHFISPWGPAETLQDNLTLRLAEVDPAIVVLNRWIEEFDQMPFARVTTMKGLLRVSDFELDIDDSIYYDLTVDELGWDDFKGLVAIDGRDHFAVAKKAKPSTKFRMH